MRINEIIGPLGSLCDSTLIDEEASIPPLSSEQLRKKNQKDQKKLQKASEITRIAAIKAATVRADVGS